jgi:hypothetical protein
MATLGKITTGLTFISLNPDFQFAFGPYTSIENGKITSISVYVTSSPRITKLGVYEDDNGDVGDLIAITEPIPAGTGWRTGEADGLIATGKSYWIAELHQSGSQGLVYDTGAKSIKYAARSYASGLSDPFSASVSILNNHDVSAYLSYNPIIPPPKLPFIPEKTTYSYKVDGDVVSVELDGGLPRKRRDIAGSASKVECTWFLSPVQYQYFMAFYRFTIKRGALPFLVDLLIEQPYLEEMKASFVANSLSMKQIGLSFEVSAELEVVPIGDDDFDEMIVLFYDESGSDNTPWNQLEQLTNYDLDVAS